MVKHYCDRCFKFIYKNDIRTILFGATYEFCNECYNKIFDFAVNRKENKDE